MLSWKNTKVERPNLTNIVGCLRSTNLKIDEGILTTVTQYQIDPSHLVRFIRPASTTRHHRINEIIHKLLLFHYLFCDGTLGCVTNVNDEMCKTQINFSNFGKIKVQSFYKNRILTRRYTGYSSGFSASLRTWPITNIVKSPMNVANPFVLRRYVSSRRTVEKTSLRRYCCHR